MTKYIDDPGAEVALRMLRYSTEDEETLSETVYYRHYPAGHKDAGFNTFVMCSDLFAWGTADLERVTEENFSELERAFKDSRELQAAQEEPDKYGHFQYLYCASALFAARQRGMRPQGAYYKYLPEPMWPLFDACGPERTTGLSNPQEHPA